MRDQEKYIVQEGMAARNLVLGRSGRGSIVQSITLRGNELKEIVSRMSEDDLLLIENWSDYSDKGRKQTYYGEVTIIKY